jgi:hypothetical protein
VVSGKYLEVSRILSSSSCLPLLLRYVLSTSIGLQNIPLAAAKPSNVTIYGSVRRSSLNA